jgi:chromosome segregation ATPase
MKNAKLKMKKLACSIFHFSFCIFTFSLLLGCAMDKAMVPDPSIEAARQHAESVVREARAEAAALRAEMAATRIKAAKKEAEIQELQRQVTQFRQESVQLRQETVELKRTRGEIQQGTESKQAEMLVLRAERDRLVQVNTATQAQLAELPKLRETMTQATTAQERLQTRVQELESSLAALTAELAQMKQMFAADRDKATARASASKKKPGGVGFAASAPVKETAPSQRLGNSSAPIPGISAAPAAGKDLDKDKPSP